MRRLFILLTLLLIAPRVRADEVKLHDGTVLEGRVEDCGDSIRIHRGGGAVTIPKTMVKSVVPAKPLEEIYEERAKKIAAGDVDARLELAKWCGKNDLSAAAEKEFRKVLAVDPDHAAAREALGYRKVEGRWMTESEIREAQGFVPHKGRWVTPEERELDLALEERKELEREIAKRVKQLLRQLSSSHEEKRAEAQSGLAAIDAKYKVEEFLSTLNRGTAHARLYAARELGDMREPRAVRSLASRAVYDRDAEVRSAALAALRGIAHENTALYFLRPLSDANQIARLRATEALARFPDFRAAGTLLKRLDENLQTLGVLQRYEQQMVRVLAGQLVLRDGRRVPLPRHIRIDTGLLDPRFRERLHNEIAATRAALRAISGSDYGAGIRGWTAWHEKEKEK